MLCAARMRARKLLVGWVGSIRRWVDENQPSLRDFFVIKSRITNMCGEIFAMRGRGHEPSMQRIRDVEVTIDIAGNEFDLEDTRVGIVAMLRSARDVTLVRCMA